MSNPGTTAAKDAPPRTKRTRRWPRVLLAVLLLLLLVVAFAPVIVAKTPLLNIIVRNATSDVHGTVTVGGASLGWFSPIELRDVRVTDPAGKPVLAAPKIAIETSLANLIRSQSDIGEIVIDQPTVEIAAEKGKTNVEEVFAKYLEPDDSAPKPERTAIKLRVVNGKVLFRDRGNELTGVDVHVQVPAPRSEPVAIEVKAGTSNAGTLRAEASLGSNSRVSVKATSFPLDVLQPVLARIDPSLALGGMLTTDLLANWSEGFASFKVEGTSRVQDLDLSAPWLRGDRLKLASVDAPIRLEANASTLKIEQAALTCELGTASIAGEFSRSGSLDTDFDRPGVSAAVQVDLARLANSLPHLTSLRAGTEVRSGSISLTLASTATPQGTTWTGNINAANLQAVRNGQTLEWKEPLAITFAGRFGSGMPEIDSLVCRSDVIAFQARGTAESFKAAANIYLDKFAERLGDFIDLDGVTLAGQAVVRAEVNRTPATGAFTATGSVDLTNFAFADASMSYREAKLDLRANAAGTFHPNAPTRIDSGNFTLTAAEDSLQLKLLEPMADASALSSGRLSAALAGNLDRWKSRLAGIVSLPAAWKIEGQGTASATLAFDGDQLKCEGLACSFERFVFRGEGLDIREPKLTAEGNVVLHRKSGAIDATHVKLACATGSANVPKLAIEPQPSGDKALVGSGTFAADLAGLERWYGSAGTVAGAATGRFKLAAVQGVTGLDATCDIKDFVFGSKSSPTWTEPTLAIVLEGALDPARDEFRLRNAKLNRDGLALQASGTYSRLATTQDLNLQGTIGYDFAKLSPLLRGLLGGGFEGAGQGSKPFRIAGSLVPPGSRGMTLAALTGDAALNWSALQAYGFEVGPGELNARLAKGTVTANRVDAKFGGGAVHVTPSFKIEPSPMTLSVEKGTIIERASLTPKSCAGALGYALPVVANAVQANGQVSFTIAENSIPVMDMTKTTLKGQLFVHSASVGTGPVIGEIAKLLGAPATSVTLANEMPVPIRVENGRVYHENLRLTVNGYAVTTNGSVGFDGSVSLVADVPVPASALGALKNNPRIMQAIANRTIKVPIGGTLAKPALDPRGFQDAIAQFVKDATKSATTDFIKGGLEKLLPKK